MKKAYIAPHAEDITFLYKAVMDDSANPGATSVPWSYGDPIDGKEDDFDDSMPMPRKIPKRTNATGYEPIDDKQIGFLPLRYLWDAD